VKDKEDNNNHSLYIISFITNKLKKILLTKVFSVLAYSFTIKMGEKWMLANEFGTLT